MGPQSSKVATVCEAVLSVPGASGFWPESKVHLSCLSFCNATSENGDKTLAVIVTFVRPLSGIIGREYSPIVSSNCRKCRTSWYSGQCGRERGTCMSSSWISLLSAPCPSRAQLSGALCPSQGLSFSALAPFAYVPHVLEQVLLSRPHRMYRWRSHKIASQGWSWGYWECEVCDQYAFEVLQGLACYGLKSIYIFHFHFIFLFTFFLFE